MGTTPPKPVVELVERFERDRKVFLSPDYKEEQLRVSSGPSLSIRHSSFVIRTFLGMPVIHEESIKVAGATKAPDYTFRLGGLSACNARAGRRGLDLPATRGYIDADTR
ncbi:hypothetical protein JXD38_12250 [candidate division WOR-3 bacterium]|nr:hypothetical protein [candidate division WOR-3 bacterium]